MRASVAPAQRLREWRVSPSWNPDPLLEQFANRADVIAWRNHRLEKEPGRKTVANDLSTLAELLRWCVNERYLPDNPVDRITRPRFVIKKEGKPLTRAQAGRWLRSIRPIPGRGARPGLTWKDVRSKRAIGVFLLNTGARNGEFCTLDVDDVRVDGETPMLRVFVANLTLAGLVAYTVRHGRQTIAEKSTAPPAAPRDRVD